ncbi:MAG TPA: methyltransferase domain-containing protein [Gaiellaceae bacterium]|nr:methyltransferase domain-containing protein [Gaiellaceae bacterium]
MPQQPPDLRGRYTAPEEQVYLRTHEQRYGLLLELVGELRPERILVVGPSYESALLRETFPAAAVNSLGWLDHRFPLRDGDRHVQFDLNDADYPELEEHDVVVCGEVIEHLRVAAVPVLRFLATGLRPNGHLILQTPNATALPKRLRMVLGRNPSDPIREDQTNPGHFHEFTVDELVGDLEEAGLETERVLVRNYFDHGSWKNRAYRAVGGVLPRTLREGITVVARKP